MADLRRIRLDRDGLITQDGRGQMRRYGLAVPGVEAVKRDPNGVLPVIGAELGWPPEFFSGGGMAVALEVADDATECLSRPLRIYYGIEPHCNLYCVGCGPRDFRHARTPVSPGFEDFLLQEMARAGTFQVQLTGGEIALRGPDLFRTLDATRSLGLAVILATNGEWSHLDHPDDFAEELARYENIIQTNISIDGSLELHERIRGAGTYAKTLQTLERLARAGLHPRITSTIFKSTCNRKELEHLVELALRYKAALQVIPVRLTGRASGHRDVMPTREGLFEYTRHASQLRSQTGVALSFNLDIFEGSRQIPIFDLHRPPSCGAPLWGVHVTHTGEVYPCGFVQAANGNGALLAGKVSERNGLLEIWLDSEVLQRVRSAGKSAACQACEDYGRGCWGGCWVAAWVETGELNGLDPYCIKHPGGAPLGSRQQHKAEPFAII